MVNVGDLLPDGFSSTVKVFWSNPLEPFEGFNADVQLEGFQWRLEMLMDLRLTESLDINKSHQQTCMFFQAPQNVPEKTPQGFNSKTNPPATFFSPKNLMAFVTKL